MPDVHAELTAALRTLIGVDCQRTLAINSLKLHFDCDQSDRGRVYLWIDPPWRLSLNGEYVTGSADWPVWDGVQDKDHNQPLWQAWCALLDPLNRTTLVDVSVGVPVPDLRLDFETGHRLETFGNSNDEYWWYYRNRVTGEIFEAGPTGISHEHAEPAED
jgi:hypothetical protein